MARYLLLLLAAVLVQVVQSALVCQNNTLLTSGSLGTNWYYTSPAPGSNSWTTTGSSTYLSWSQGRMPFSTDPTIQTFNCQNSVTPTDATQYQTVLPENILLGQPALIHALRSTFTLSVDPTTLTHIYFRAVHDDDILAIFINGVQIPVQTLPGFSCVFAYFDLVAPFTSYNLVQGANSISVLWQNVDRAAYLDFEAIATSCTQAGGGDPWFQDHHGHSYYSKYVGPMQLCSAGKYVLTGYSVPACNVSLLTSSVLLWQNKDLVQPHCTNVASHSSDLPQISSSLFGLDYQVVSTQHCETEGFGFHKTLVYLPSCGFETVVVFPDQVCERGFMSHEGVKFALGWDE